MVESTTISGYSAWRCVKSTGRECQIALGTRQEQKIVLWAGGWNEEGWCAKAATAVGYLVQNLHG